MTEVLTARSGASFNAGYAWNLIDWDTMQAHVHRLQMRIAKAYKEGRHNKVKTLQWLLTHSFAAKLLAVKRVTSNQGAKTPGVDKILWRTPQQKMRAALSLKRHGYQPQPLRRIYIPKKQKGKFRPLSIPAMSCRAQQALHLLALDPIAETIADKNAYGFRPYRSTADATEQCFYALSHRGSAQYILEGDIKSCFDTISQDWLRQHVPMDKVMLNKWLNAGYIEKGNWHPTEFGVPQGGTISPTLLVITLSGLENAVKSVISQREDKVHVCSYADDFIITGATKEVLENKVMPTLENFLLERGLVLSKEKTRITHIDKGFDFLGSNFRKYDGKLIRKPAKDNIRKFLENIRETIKSNATAKTENLIHQLNPKIRGWGNYHRYSCAKQTFVNVGHHIFEALWRWAKRRHPTKSVKWIHKKYYRSERYRHWIFYDKIKDKKGKSTFIDLLEIAHTPIRRHIKFKAEANPYDPEYQTYIAERLERRRKKQLVRYCKSHWSPWWELNELDEASV